jgi:antitoxin (DNA-binding transcriptional repressor) of toxin-antitoxin stability system
MSDMTETITARTLARETSRVLDSLAQHPRGLIVSRGGAEVAKLVPLSPVEVAWRASMVGAGHDPDAPIAADPTVAMLEVPPGGPSLTDTLAAQRAAERH